jgi:hypothetical protein
MSPFLEPNISETWPFSVSPTLLEPNISETWPFSVSPTWTWCQRTRRRKGRPACGDGQDSARRSWSCYVPIECGSTLMVSSSSRRADRRGHIYRTLPVVGSTSGVRDGCQRRVGSGGGHDECPTTWHTCSLWRRQRREMSERMRECQGRQVAAR